MISYGRILVVHLQLEFSLDERMNGAKLERLAGLMPAAERPTIAKGAIA